MSRASLSLEPDRLLPVLRERLGRQALELAEPPNQLAGGRETEIFRLRLKGVPELEAPLVLRAIRPDYDPTRALWEAAVQNAAAGAGLPVPRALFAETDPAVLGQAFVVMEWCPGVPMTGAFAAEVDAASGGSRLAFAFFLARSLARAGGLIREWIARLTALQLRLHALDTTALRREVEALDIARVASADGRIDELEERVEHSGLDGLRPGVAWLRERRPPDRGPVICHGDFLPVNVLEEDGAITGLIDWSFAKLADPEYDFAATCFIYPVAAHAAPPALRLPLRAVTRRLRKRYEDAYRAGRALDAGRVDYYEALRNFNELSALGDRRVRARGEVAPPNAQEPFAKGYLARFEILTGVSVALPPLPAEGDAP